SWYITHRDLHSFPTLRSSDLHRAAAKSSLRPPAHGHSAASCQVLSDPTTVNRPQKQPQHPVLRPEQHESIDASTSRPRSSTSHRSEEHTSELQSRFDLVCRLL